MAEQTEYLLGLTKEELIHALEQKELHIKRLQHQNAEQKKHIFELICDVEEYRSAIHKFKFMSHSLESLRGSLNYLVKELDGTIQLKPERSACRLHKELIEESSESCV